MILHQKVITGQAFNETEVELGEEKLGYSNLTKAQNQGLKEIAEGIKSKGWLCGKTDKSHRLVLGTKEAYLNQMAKHATGDQIVPIEEVVAQESQLYDNTVALLRGFGFGREHPGETDRIVQSMKPGYCRVAPLSE